MTKKTWDPTYVVLLLAAAMVAGATLATGGLGPSDWRADQDRDGDSVSLELRRAGVDQDARFAFSVATKELEGFDADAFGTPGAPLRIMWRRDPGTLVLEGQGGRHPGGKFHFDPDPTFAERWRSLGFETGSENDLFLLAMEGLRIADAERLHAMGYRGVGLHDLLRLRWHDVDMDWIEALQQLNVHPEIEDLIRLHDHGISAEQARAFASSGLPWPGTEGLLRLHMHGVGADYVHGMVESALPSLSVEDLVRLHAHGVAADYVQGLVQAGPGKRGSEAVILLHDHGVGAEWIRGMAELGYGELPAGDLARLHAHGISVDLVRTLAGKGHADLSTEQIIHDANHM